MLMYGDSERLVARQGRIDGKDCDQQNIRKSSRHRTRSLVWLPVVLPTSSRFGSTLTRAPSCPPALRTGSCVSSTPRSCSTGCQEPSLTYACCIFFLQFVVGQSEAKLARYPRRLRRYHDAVPISSGPKIILDGFARLPPGDSATAKIRNNPRRGPPSKVALRGCLSIPSVSPSLLRLQALDSVTDVECPVRSVGFLRLEEQGVYCCSNTDTLVWPLQQRIRSKRLRKYMIKSEEWARC